VPAKLVLVTPLVPKLVSRLPSELYRVMPKDSLGVVPMVPMMTDWVPSSASSRQPRQNAWGWVFFCASGRSPACNSSANKAHGNTERRSAKVLSARRSPSNASTCSAKVPGPLSK